VNNPGYGGNALAPRADNGVVVAGNLLKGGLQYGWATLLDATGKQLWSKQYGPGAKADDHFSDAVPAADGGTVLAGLRSKPKDVARAWLARVNGSGLILWERVFQLSESTSSAFNVVRAVGDGDFVAAGNDGYKGVLVRCDGNGKLRWHRGGGPGNSGGSWGLGVLPNGFVYTDKLYDVEKPNRLIRTDGWGNYSCADAGKCPTQPPSACKTSDPCKMDSCTAASSCNALNALNGIWCDDGKWCQAGQCVAMP
jgi:hypothetical protein